MIWVWITVRTENQIIMLYIGLKQLGMYKMFRRKSSSMNGQFVEKTV